MKKQQITIFLTSKIIDLKKGKVSKTWNIEEEKTLNTLNNENNNKKIKGTKMFTQKRERNGK